MADAILSITSGREEGQNKKKGRPPPHAHIYSIQYAYVHINWKKDTICIICWALFQQGQWITRESHSVCGDWLFTFSEPPHRPPHPIPQVRGEGSEVKGEVAGCLSWRKGAGVGGPLAQPLSLVWEERSRLLLPSHTSGCPQNAHLEGKQECFYFPGEKKNSGVKPQS